ncbi:MAG: hypothetical protein NUW37_16345, partial [Planctomycetes bacterium]|nr:hypothetical protein [Planctomycetota bacterium]
MRIPEGSLEEDTRITLSFPRTSSVGKHRGFARLTDVIRIEPSGLDMRFPAIVTLSMGAFESLTDEQVKNLVVLSNHPNEGRINVIETVSVDREKGEVVFATPHFSDFVVTEAAQMSSSGPFDSLANDILELAAHENTPVAATLRLRVAAAYLIGNDNGDPIVSAKLYNSIGDNVNCIARMRDSVHGLVFAKDAGCYIGGIAERLLQTIKNEILSNYNINSHPPCQELIAIADGACQNAEFDLAAHYYYLACQSLENNSNQGSALSRAQSSNLVISQTPLPDEPTYEATLGAVWRFLVDEPITYTTDPILSPPLDTSGFNPPGDNDLVWAQTDGFTLNDSGETDDGGVIYQIDASGEPNGVVVFDTFGYGAAPGTPNDPRWVGSDPYEGSYNGIHTASDNRIPAGVTSGMQDFQWTNTPGDPEAIIENGILNVSSTFHAEIERVQAIDIVSNVPGAGFTKTTILNPDGLTSTVDPVALCEETELDFIAHLEYGMHPELIIWRLYIDGVEQFRFGGPSFTYTFPQAEGGITEYTIEATQGNINIPGLKTQVLAVTPDIVILNSIDENMQEFEILEEDSPYTIAEPVTIPLEGILKWSGFDETPDTADDLICNAPWTFELVAETHPGVANINIIDDTHAELEFVSIDPLDPNVLPIDYEAEFIFKPNRPGINIEYHIAVKTPEPEITITQSDENICVNEEVVFTASFDDTDIDIENLGFALYYIENGNPVEIPPPGDARAQLVSLTEDAES